MRIAGVHFRANGKQLRIRIPDGTDPKLIDAIREYQDDFYQAYNSRAATLYYGYGLHLEVAEHAAANEILGLDRFLPATCRTQP